ncbi:MAG: PilZ domain-containing protein [Acidobacteriota bacterium]
MRVNLYKVVVPVSDLGQAESFYLQLLGVSGRKFGLAESHFDCGNVVLCCRQPDPRSETSSVALSSPRVCLAVEDLDAAFEKAKTAGCSALDQELRTQPWGDRSFVARDPFGNTIVFVDEGTRQREASEQASGGPNGLFATGQVVTIQRASEGRSVASVVKIFGNEMWLKRELDGEVAPLGKGEAIQLQYYDATGAFSAGSEVINSSSADPRYVALAIPQEANAIQRRAAPRLRLVIPVSFSLFASPDSEEVSEEVFNARSHDISTGGVRLETEAQITTGDKVQLTLTLSESLIVTVIAKVMASQQAEVKGKTLTSAGVQFVEMELQDQIDLLQFLIEDEGESEVSPEEGVREIEAAPPADGSGDGAENSTAPEETDEEGGEKLQIPPIVQSSISFDGEKVVLSLLNGFREGITVKSVMVSKEAGSLTPLLDEPLQLSPGQAQTLDMTGKLIALFNSGSAEAQETHLHILFKLDPEPPDQPAPTSYLVRFENGALTRFDAED